MIVARHTITEAPVVQPATGQRPRRREAAHRPFHLRVIGADVRIIAI